MATYFKKRKKGTGPNKNEQKVMRGNQARSPLGSRFPSVKQLRVHLVFLDAQQNILDEKNLTLAPGDSCFDVESCPGRCGKGSFNFSPRIDTAVKAGLPVVESSEKCAQALYANSPDVCGCEAKCRMEFDYFPAPPAPAVPPAPAA